jgi:hypothetical protein
MPDCPSHQKKMKMDTSKFSDFFVCCVGSWVSERTYHYLTQGEVERSRTEFTIAPLTAELKLKVLADNQYAPPSDLASIPGFSLGFYTISEKGEEVSQDLNLLFVPQRQGNGYLEGDYLRDRAYEEAKAIVSYFRFNLEQQELLMTTKYTRVVSVDSIRLIEPKTRIRNILNYQRPPAGQPLENLVLVGFGVERKEE